MLTTIFQSIPFKIQRNRVLTHALKRSLHYTIKGCESQTLILGVEPKEKLQFKPGSFMSHSSDLSLFETKLRKGLLNSFFRYITGSTFWYQTYKNRTNKTTELMLRKSTPGQIAPLTFNNTLRWNIFHGKHLCSTYGVKHHTNFRAYLQKFLFNYGCRPFVFEAKSTNEIAFLTTFGSATRFELQNGERVIVSPRNLVAFEDTVNVSYEFVSGFKNNLFGFKKSLYPMLIGPGEVILQSLSERLFKVKAINDQMILIDDYEKSKNRSNF
ncbi:tryptophan RNA-binding attenuator protein-like protein [Anaeramoeba flamelloides]|uniref:Tryptophan RNA-binding attenuator protein-like protein n=1 Tax=Anaeramoeba flamelloides TaxID=1746091 RepID=A0AAV7ZLH7_9EUKA|nr:tryptophan RNA-binding attenuator protein-like protein [Anaeramoeba flamelloides]